ncbi:putative B3 domain-containing protein At5g66980 [Coffea arabica]|uniref:B3 domain-containing protein At5g66980 n=1 Tax=Coffea arabica TaxID=13443 RepID=A0A6P6SSJ6_COFAR
MKAVRQYPAFMKAYFPPDSKQSLKLPSSFTSFLKSSLPDKVFLKNHYDDKRIWAVEVAKIENDLFFQAGWSQFLAENCLEFGDLLVFQYNGGQEFDFKILGKTADKREVIYAFDFSSEEQQEEEYPQEMESENKSRRGAVGLKTKSNSDSGRQEEFEEVSSKKKQKRDFQGSAARKRSLQRREISENKAGRSIKACGKGVHFIDNTADAEFKSRDDRPITPCFVAKVDEKRSNLVHVPKDLVTACGIYPEQTVTILDPAGNKRTTKVKQWQDGRFVMAGSWKFLFIRNGMRHKDSFLCEFVQGADPSEALIKVYPHRKK